MVADPAPHPATFNDDILAAINTLLPTRRLSILDPFAGVGRVHELRSRGHSTYGIEIEPEWADQHEHTIVGNVLELDEALNRMFVGYYHTGPWRFDAIVTSPCYGNRMADRYAGDAKGTRRHTYRTYLGRDLHPTSSGSLQWGKQYRVFHRRAWAEVTRVVEPGGLFILNVKDHIRKGKIQPVTKFHLRTLELLGWGLEEEHRVQASGIRHGENHEARVWYETVARLRRRKMKWE